MTFRVTKSSLMHIMAKNVGLERQSEWILTLSLTSFSEATDT